MSLKNKHLSNGDYFALIACFLLAFNKLRYEWTGGSAVELNIEIERITVVRSRCRQNIKFGNFTLSFGKPTTSKNSTRASACRT